MKAGLKNSLSVLCLTLALTLSGCGGEKRDRAEIGKTVDDFMTAVLASDTDGMLACVDESSDYYAQCAENGAVDLSAAGLGLDGENDIFSSKAFVDGVAELTKKRGGYTLDAVTFTGEDEAEAEVTLSLLDFGSVDLSEYLSLDDIEFDMEGFLAYAQERGYDAAAFLALDADEGEALVNEYISGDGYNDKIVSGILAAMDEGAVTSQTKTALTLKRVNGHWAITGETSVQAEKNGQNK